MLQGVKEDASGLIRVSEWKFEGWGWGSQNVARDDSFSEAAVVQREKDRLRC